jgi:sporulation protein YlmC with PRC-barrel domain
MQNIPTRLARTTFTTVSVMALLCGIGPAAAQVAGATTTTETSVTESTKMAMGWSVKKTLLGKTIYNDAGNKVGKVDDLILSPDRDVSYVIVGAGGFVGIGRHDVAIPITQIQNKAGKLVMPGATKDTIKGMPEFVYASDTSKRDTFVAAADQDIAKGKAKVTALEQKAGAAAAGTKAKIDLQISAVRQDVTSAESKLAELKQATAARWKEYEAGVNAATARLRKSIETAKG